VFVLAIKDMDINLTFQEEASLLRKWDIGDFKINIEDAYSALQQA